MITSLATNNANDIYLTPSGNIALVTGIDAVKQDCEHAMKAQYGEMVLEADSGIPYADTVFTRVNLVAFEAASRRALSSINGVVQVESFAVAVNNGILAYDAGILTIFGLTKIQGFSASG